MSKFKSSAQRKAVMAKLCNERVSRKIGINTKEFKKGKFVSIDQAKAVSISQIQKKHPECRVFLVKRKGVFSGER